MQYTRLGRTDLKVSRICFGCAAIGGYDYGPVDDVTCIAALRRAAECGINFFDVADVYGFGRAENLLREAFGPKLRELVVATKFGVQRDDSGRTYRDISPSTMRKALEGSLGRLGLEAIPLYQIHWPDGRTQMEDCVAELEACRREGKILHYGACNLGVDDVRSAQAAGRLESLQVPFSLVERQYAATLDACHGEMGMSTLIYNALGHGLFTGKYTEESSFSGTDLRTRVPLFTGAARARGFAMLGRVREVAERNGRMCAEVALAWCLRQPSVDIVITGAKTPEQAETNAMAADWVLRDPEPLFSDSST